MSASSLFAPPGDTTGVYYLVFGNVEKTLEWTQIKDYARGKGLEIEWVEIHENNLGAWIRVSGRDNYILACAIFTDAVFNGKVLQVDARNDVHSINLRFPPRQHPNAQRTTSNLTYGTENSQFGTTDNTITSVADNQSLYPYNYAFPNYSIQQDYVPGFISPPVTTPFSAQFPHSYLPHTQEADFTTPRTSDVMVVFRKVVVKKLSQKTTTKGLEELIAWALHADSYYEGLIEKYEFFRNEKGRHKGTAYVYMANFADATTAVTSLNGVKHGGHVLEATLATEGAPPMIYTQDQTHQEHWDGRSVTPAIVDGSGSRFVLHDGSYNQNNNLFSQGESN